LSDEIILRDQGVLNDIYKSLQEELHKDPPIVVLCGPGKCEEDSCERCDEEKKLDCFYHERLMLRQRLREEDCMPVIFEEDFNLAIASLEETLLLYHDEIDKVVVIPASEGSAAELALFARDKIINRKLIVLVPYEYHPWYSDSASLLTSLYIEILGSCGHIYPFDKKGENHPLATDILSSVMRSYRLNKIADLLF